MLGQLQKIGKALMLPIAVLPAAGLLLRLGQPDTLNIPFMANTGNAIFANLALLFAIGVAVGIAKDNHGLAGLSGFLAYEILSIGATQINNTISLGVLGGIVAGLLAGWLFNRFDSVKVPKALDFSGSRGLALLSTTILSIPLALIFGYVWPVVQNLFNTVGHWLSSTGAIGAGVYGLLNRLLIPFGLHHVINVYIWFVYGTFHGKTGDLSRFFAGDPTAGGYMAGFFPIMMFGLPAAALAMVAAAKPDKRKAVAGALGSAAFVSFLTGITEPIEFAFMFLAPVLYVIHAIFTGFTMFITYALGIRDGFSFSAGAIDYVINRGYATHGWWLIPIGLIVGAVYFVVFYFSIKIFNIKTPGREDENDPSGAHMSIIFDELQLAPNDETRKTDEIASDSEFDSKAAKYVQALGGRGNIVEIEACTTRLRLNLKDMGAMNEAALKTLGASGVMKLDSHHAQVVVGTVADMLVEDMQPFLK